MMFTFVVLYILTIVYAVPYGNSIQNLNTLILNCPGGQLWTNAGCRDTNYLIRTALSSVSSDWQVPDMSSPNTVTVPPNCPPDQQYGNGACRDPFRNFVPDSDILSPHVIIVPQNCPVGQEYINGLCRDKFRRVNVPKILLLKRHPENLFHDYIRQILQNRIGLVDNTNIINSYPRLTDVPKQCPIGYRLDAKGRCRQRI